VSDPARWSAWANWGKTAIELLALVFACGVGYAELQQVKRDVEAQKQEIKEIRSQFLPREIFSIEMQNAREAIQEIRNIEIETQRSIKRFR
jgi:Tfp pilus assembly protein PilO